MFSEALVANSYFIAVAPLVAFLALIFLGRRLGAWSAWIGVAALGYGLVHSLLICTGIFNGQLVLPYEGLQGHFFQKDWVWFSTGSFEFRLGVLIDGLSASMLVVVTLVAFLVQLYSVSYMHNHSRFLRYFAYVNLFTFSMLILVLANNMLQFFIGWEGVGLCSFLLISFDYERDSAAYAGRKAFITTKLADLGFYAGLMIIFNYIGTFNIPSLHQNIQNVQYPSWVLVSVPILLFIGAMGKSAQVPLHVWLPDAMEGPTPASALIHAATMVAAGVFMVARVFFMYEAAPISLEVVAWIGTITAVVAATMGLVNNDIKRVLAFSTVSQLGFMMAALGCGGYQAGMFHLITHAGFKALLFLCAGSVIHSVHTNNMWQMGGLMKKMPITAITYGIATLAIIGFPGFAGFFSKEEVLAAALHHNPVIFTLLGLAAFMTTFYMLRTWFLTFTGSPRDIERFHHAHESPLLMTIPLMVLAVPSFFLGFFFWYRDRHNLNLFVHWGEHAVHHEGHLVLYVSLGAVVLGGFLAWVLYSSRGKKYEILGKVFALPHHVLTNRYFVDEVYLFFIDRIYHPVSRLMANFDYNIIDQGMIDGFGRLGKMFAWIGDLFDGRLIDRWLVDGNSDVVNKLGSFVRRAQSGLAQSYLFWMAVGLGFMFVWMAQKFN